MPTIARYYSSTAAKTTLSQAIDASTTSTSLSLAAASGLPSQYPFTLILEKDTANEEIVTVTALVGTAYTVTRGVDGTSSKAHSVGAVVEHGVSALDFSDFRTHEAATNAHGVTGDIVGTGGAQTLTGKTLTTATLGSILDAGGYKITNLATPTSSSDAVRKDFADAQVTAAASSATAAASSATAAASSATAAATSATSASNSASAASTSAASALTSQTAAATSAASALTSQTAAATSAASALASQTAAATSAASALASQTAAATSATSAANSATAAATSATSAANSATTASNSAATAVTSASQAATSAASAATSATSASSSATTVAGQVASGLVRDMGAITDADNSTGTWISLSSLEANVDADASAAATSAASALTSATSAASSATTASNSAATAVTSASQAATSASSAATSAASALTSQTSAATSATSAETSATSAASSATTASNSAATAVTSASQAATSANSAATSASSAATSASSANTSASSAATSYDNFDDRYLGSKASAPTLDNDGDALLEGALYWNSTNKNMNVYNGTAWEVVTTSGDITAVTAGTGLSGGGGSGAVTVSLDTSSVYVLPSQTGNNGYFLRTNGTSATWTSISDWGTIV
jgi:hypothetical protein